LVDPYFKLTGKLYGSGTNTVLHQVSLYTGIWELLGTKKLYSMS